MVDMSPVPCVFFMPNGAVFRVFHLHVSVVHSMFPRHSMARHCVTGFWYPGLMIPMSRLHFLVHLLRMVILHSHILMRVMISGMRVMVIGFVHIVCHDQSS
jgi:hypothetical protein